MKNRFRELQSDTWAIIGVVVGVVGGWSVVIVTVMLALHSATNARIDAQGARIDAQGARIDMLHDTMRNEHTLILESIAGVAQRVSYIEGHLGVGRAADPEPAVPP